MAKEARLLPRILRESGNGRKASKCPASYVNGCTFANSHEICFSVTLTNPHGIINWTKYNIGSRVCLFSQLGNAYPKLECLSSRPFCFFACSQAEFRPSDGAKERARGRRHNRTRCEASHPSTGCYNDAADSASSGGRRTASITCATSHA